MSKDFRLEAERELQSMDSLRRLKHLVGDWEANPELLTGSQLASEQQPQQEEQLNKQCSESLIITFPMVCFDLVAHIRMFEKSSSQCTSQGNIQFVMRCLFAWLL